MTLALALFLAGAQDAETSRKVLQLIEQLGSDAPEKRDQAVQELTAAADAALPALRKAALERDGEIRSRAKDLVRWIEVQKLLTPRLKKLFPDLEPALLAGEPGAWGSAFLDLRHGTSAELDDLTKRERGLIYEKALLEADDDEERVEILVEALVQPGSMDPAGTIALLSSPNAEVRRMAARALRVVGGPGAAAPLRKALADADEAVRCQAAESLGCLKAMEAVGDLKRLLAGPSVGLAASAASGLGMMGDRSAEPELRALLKRGEALLRRAGAHALADLGVEDGPLLLVGVLHEAEFADQLEAAEKLASLGPRAVPALRASLKDANAVARRLAAEALGTIGSKDAEPDLAALLVDANGRVRAAAVDALAELGAAGRSGAFVPLLADPWWQVRLAAARALGSLGAKEAVPALRGLLRNEGGYVKIAAAVALCELGDESGAPVLLDEADNRYRLVEEAVPLTALNALREPGTWNRLRTALLAAPVEGRVTGTLLKLTEAARLKLELTESDSDLDDSDNPWSQRRLRVKADGRRTLLEAIRGTRGNGAFDYVLEPGALRVLPHSEALQFWSDWWKSRSKKP